MSDKLANGDVASFTEKAYQAILGAIARLELKPGETLTQDRLAKWLAISRTPVREALRRLEQDGLIVSANKRWVNLLRAARPGAVASTCPNRHST